MKLDSKLARAISVLALGVVTPMTLTSCYGTFPLTREVYRINGQIGDGIESQKVEGVVESILMWIPGGLVYGIAGFIDVFILNLVEFWTGDPIVISQSFEMQDGSMVALQTLDDGSTLSMTVERDGAVVSQRTFVRLGDGVTEMRDAEGRSEGFVRSVADGGLELYDRDGALVSTVARADLRDFVLRMAAERS